MAREGTAAIPVDDAAFWSASLTDYLVPNPRHPIWGGAVQSLVWPIPETDMPYEFLLSVGWITLILALIAWRRARGPSFRAWKWTIAVAVLFSLGPLLNISRLVTPLPLPALLLRELIPFAEGVRRWGRFAIVAMLGFSLLAAGGMGLLLVRRSQRAQWAVSALVCGLVLFGAWPGGAELVKVGPREVDTWLAAQPDPSPLMEYPLDVALSGPAVLATRYHQKPVVFGYGTYFPYLFRERYPQLAEFPGDAALDLLEAWGVRTILLHTNALNPSDFTLAEVEAQPRLTIIRAFGDTLALELQP